MKIFPKLKGFTVLEVLIASSIFVIVTTIGTAILLNTISVERTTRIRNAVYEDTRVLMELLANYISSNAIDYEEYFSQNVVQAGDGEDRAFGVYYGIYGSRFYDPQLYLASKGSTSGSEGENPAQLGVQCTDPFNGSIGECEEGGIYTSSIDTFEGRNFFDNSDQANAFCDTGSDFALSCDDDSASNTAIITDELFLINADASRKTIFARQRISADDYSLGILEMEGVDSDSNGNFDLYRCLDNYNCENTALFTDFYDGIEFPGIEDQDSIDTLGIATARYSDLDTVDLVNQKFIPLMPLRTTIESVKFIINPPEDPYRALYEQKHQIQPSVTIIIEAKPAFAEREKYPGGWPNNGTDDEVIRLQRTVNTGEYSEILSHPTTNDLKWICKVVKGPSALECL